MGKTLRFQNVWERIKYRMDVLGIETLVDAAERCGLRNHKGEIDPQPLRNIEAGNTGKNWGTKDPKSITLAKIASGLGTTEAWLRDESGPEDATVTPVMDECMAVAKSLSDAIRRIVRKNDIDLQEAAARLLNALSGEPSAPAKDEQSKPKRSKTRGK